MDELKWERLTEIQGRAQADMLKAYFQANGIEVELFQESLGQHIYPTTLDILGNVQVFVPKEQIAAARKLLEEYFNPPEEVEETASEEEPKPTARKTRKSPKKITRKAVQKPVSRKTRSTLKKTIKPASKSTTRKSK